MGNLIDVPIFYADKNKKFKKYIDVDLEHLERWGYKLTSDPKKADFFVTTKNETFEIFYNKIIENFQKSVNGKNENIEIIKFRCVPYYLGLKFKRKNYICLKMNPFKYRLAKIKEFVRIKPERIK